MICNWKNAAMKSTARKSVFDLHQDLHYNLCSLTMADIIWMVEKPTSIFALLKVNVLFYVLKVALTSMNPMPNLIHASDVILYLRQHQNVFKWMNMSV